MQDLEVLDTSVFGLKGEPNHERIVVATDPTTGLKAIIAIYSTARGPAFGGCRFWSYDADAHALTDALRLSQGMAFKNALADLPFGGGKAVIVRAPKVTDRRELFASFGRFVQSLNGSYITAEDVGTTADDMRAVQSQTAFVSGIPRTGETYGGNPSPRTAFGVFVGLKSAVKVAVGRDSIEGLTVAVQGLGSVGWDLCVRLHEEGAKLVVADVHADKTDQAKQQFGATVVDPKEVVWANADVFAPCALGGTVTRAVAERCQFKVIAGGANNQLVSLNEGDILQQRGVFYAPDFLINAGGIISCAREYLGNARESEVMSEVAKIGPRLEELAARCQVSSQAPAREAVAWAEEKISNVR